MSWADYDAVLPPDGVIELTYPVEDPGHGRISYFTDYYTRHQGEIYNLCVRSSGEWTVYRLYRDRMGLGKGRAEHRLASNRTIAYTLFADQMMEMEL